MATLKVLMKAGHTVEVISRFKEHFEESHRVRVETVILPEAEVFKKLMSGDCDADLVTVPYWYLADLVEAGLLYPIPEPSGEESFHPLASAAMRYQSSDWARAHTLVGGALAVRRDRMGQLSSGATATWAGWIDFLKQALESGHTIALRSNPDFSSAETYRGLAYASGIDLFHGGSLPDVETLDTALGPLLNLLQAQGLRLQQLDYSGVGGLFTGGQADMMFDTSAWSTILAAHHPEVFRNSDFYAISRDPAAQFFYAEGLGIFGGSKQEALAYEFIQWRQSKELLEREICEINRIDFPRLDIREERWFTENLSQKRGNTSSLQVVDDSWGAIDPAYIVKQPGYVSWCETLMSVISQFWTNPERGLADAYRHALSK